MGGEEVGAERESPREIAARFASVPGGDRGEIASVPGGRSHLKRLLQDIAEDC